MPDPNILVRWSQHLLQTSPPFYINTTEEPYEQVPPTCMQGPTLGKLCLDCQEMKKIYIQLLKQCIILIKPQLWPPFKDNRESI